MPVVTIDAPESPARAKEGHVVISWSVPADYQDVADLRFVLQQSRSADFTDPVVRYEGRDLASFLSGLPDGEFHFRVRAESAGSQGEWSQPLELMVDYPRSGTVFLLMSVGTICLIALVFTILAGARKTDSLPTAGGAG